MQAEAVQNLIKNASEIHTDMVLKINENWVILESSGVIFGGPKRVRCDLRFQRVSGLSRGPSWAALGRSWAPSWPVLGANLEPSWLPREHQKRTKMILKIERFLDTLWHLLFLVFDGFLGANMNPCWHQNRIWKRSYVETA